MASSRLRMMRSLIRFPRPGSDLFVSPHKKHSPVWAMFLIKLSYEPRPQFAIHNCRTAKGECQVRRAVERLNYKIGERSSAWHGTKKSQLSTDDFVCD